MGPSNAVFLEPFDDAFSGVVVLCNVTVVTYRGTSPIWKRPPPWDPRHRPTVGSYGGAFSYERGIPVVLGGDSTARVRREGGDDLGARE